MEIFGFVMRAKRRVPLVKHDLFTIPEHQISFSSCFSRVRVVQSIVFCVMFCRSLFIILFIFHLVSVLSVSRFTVSDNHFDSIKLFMRSYAFHVWVKCQNLSLNIWFAYSLYLVLHLQHILLKVALNTTNTDP